MENYIDNPCNCEFGTYCPHYDKTLVGRIWELVRMTDNLGYSYRKLWATQVQEKNDPPKPKSSLTAETPRITTNVTANTTASNKGCGCQKKLVSSLQKDNAS